MPVNWHGDEAIRRMRAGAAKGLTRAAKALLAESQARVPVDTGDLRRSGATHDATPAELVSKVTYNAASEDGFPYGIAVHEGLDMEMKLDHNPGAQSKYLERPAIEMQDKLMGIVAQDIKREVG